jgi:hypothetical protein
MPLRSNNDLTINVFFLKFYDLDSVSFTRKGQGDINSWQEFMKNVQVNGYHNGPSKQRGRFSYTAE